MALQRRQNNTTASKQHTKAKAIIKPSSQRQALRSKAKKRQQDQRNERKEAASEKLSQVRFYKPKKSQAMSTPSEQRITNQNKADMDRNTVCGIALPIITFTMKNTPTEIVCNIENHSENTQRQ